MEKPPKLGEYDGKGGRDEHVQQVNDRMNYSNANEASKMLVCINYGRVDLVVVEWTVEQEHRIMEEFMWMIFYALYFPKKTVGDWSLFERDYPREQGNHAVLYRLIYSSFN